MSRNPRTRLTGVLEALGVATSSWYRRPVPADRRKRPGPRPRAIPDDVVGWVVRMARDNPWYGYKRIAVMCRRAGQKVKNRQAYQVMKQFGLLRKPLRRRAELYQAKKLYELLPNGPNDLWQMDVTYIHIPGFGWGDAVTVIDYYSRYLPACHLTSGYSAAEVLVALGLAREEAERLCGPLARLPFRVTDNGPSFVARRFGEYVQGLYSHVRIAYRTPTHLGLLERFHRTLKEEEVYWRLYDGRSHCRECLAEFRDRYHTLRPHWALVPEGGGDPVTPHEVYVDGVAVGIPKCQAWARAAREKLDRMWEEAVA